MVHLDASTQRPDHWVASSWSYDPSEERKIPDDHNKDIFVKILIKAIPLPPCRDKGKRSYSFYSFLTSVLDGCKWLASRPDRSLPPVPIEYEAVWASELVWAHRLEDLENKSFASAWDRNPVARLSMDPSSYSFAVIIFSFILRSCFTHIIQ
jgi:hypothetical protein